AAANLHAAVALAALESHLEGQLEVAVLLFAAQEGVERDVLLAAADNCPVLDLPVLLQPLPAVEVLAVEELAGLALGPCVRDAGQTEQEQARQDESHGVSPV